MVQEYRAHSHDARQTDWRRALLKAAIVTGPIAVGLLASQAL